MKSIHTPLFTATVLLGLSHFAMAQTATPTTATTSTTATPNASADASAGRMEKKHPKMAARHAQQLAALKSKLKLDASQEPAWSSFAQAMHAPGPHTARPDRAALEKLSTPERLDAMQAQKNQRDAQMQKRNDATKAFYAVLNADQKKVFDDETAKAMGTMAAGTHAAKHHAQRP